MQAGNNILAINFQKLTLIKVIRRVFLLLMLLLPTLCLHAQVIKGKVTDSETGKPIAYASVYLNGTYVGTTTDTLGRFSLTTTKTNIPLVISYVGYQSQEITNYADTATLNIFLKHTTQLLDEVTISADEMSREKKMKIFLREFIGSTNEDCVITNPDDIWLHYNKKLEKLTAGSDKPLIIYNKKLGYRITYFLGTFKYIPLKTSYQGNYIFADDTAGLKPAEITKIQQERNKVYFGSRLHFIRSLWNNKLSENNFKVHRAAGKILEGGKTIYTYTYLKADKDTTLLGYKNLIKVVSDHVYHNQQFIIIPTEISVTYQLNKNNMQTSFIRLGDYRNGAFIDSDGNYGPGLQWQGDMGISRVNQLLPNEFQPVNK